MELDKWIRDQMHESCSQNLSGSSNSVLHCWTCNSHEDIALCFSPFGSESITFACCVVTRFTQNNTRDTPQFTGIPIDILYTTQVEDLKLEMDKIMKKFELMRNALIADYTWTVVKVC